MSPPLYSYLLEQKPEILCGKTTFEIYIGDMCLWWLQLF